MLKIQPNQRPTFLSIYESSIIEIMQLSTNNKTDILNENVIEI